MLIAERVTKRYRELVALEDISLTVEAGECVALVGESGSGKTTLLRCFNRMVRPDAGVVRVEGRDVASVEATELRRRIGYVQQEGGLLPHWRVVRNAALVPWLQRRRDAQALATDALVRVGLGEPAIATRWPRQLSGGQRQRVAIARAIAARPRIVLLDEPFGALDAITRSDLHEMFSALRHELAMTVLLVTHDLNEAARLADRIAVLRAGRIEQVATPAALAAQPANEYVARLVARARMHVAES